MNSEFVMMLFPTVLYMTMPILSLCLTDTCDTVILMQNRKYNVLQTGTKAGASEVKSLLVLLWGDAHPMKTRFLSTMFLDYINVRPASGSHWITTLPL